MQRPRIIRIFNTQSHAAYVKHIHILRHFQLESGCGPQFKIIGPQGIKQIALGKA